MASRKTQGSGVIQGALQWGDGRKIIMGRYANTLLFRMEAEPLAMDDDVLDAMDELERRMQRAYSRSLARPSGRVLPLLRAR